MPGAAVSYYQFGTFSRHVRLGKFFIEDVSWDIFGMVRYAAYVDKFNRSNGEMVYSLK